MYYGSSLTVFERQWSLPRKKLLSDSQRLWGVKEKAEWIAVTIVRCGRALVNCQVQEMQVFQRGWGWWGSSLTRSWKASSSCVLWIRRQCKSHTATKSETLRSSLAPHLLVPPTCNGLEHGLRSTSFSFCTNLILLSLT